MRIHREGRKFLSVAIIIAILTSIVVWRSGAGTTLSVLIYIVLVLILIFLLNFFRNPGRPIGHQDASQIYAPADGTIVVIEETAEPEYFKDTRLQVSIFMSPLDVHVNRIPVSGEVVYTKYHRGKYLLAWHPKSSTENERNTVVVDTGRYAILIRQIAGFMAKRIRCYVTPGQNVKQGDELGFIKFGSRVDIFLPVDAEVRVRLRQHVKGNRTLLATVLEEGGG